MSTKAKDLTVRNILSTYNALPILDGYVESATVETVTTEDPKTGEKKTTVRRTTTKPVPYKFGADGKGGGKIRYAIAKNTSILGHENEAFTKARDALILELSGGTGSIDESDTVLINKLNVMLQPTLDTVVTVHGLMDISLADLNLDANPDLLPSALAPLMVLITE